MAPIDGRYGILRLGLTSITCRGDTEASSLRDHAGLEECRARHHRWLPRSGECAAQGIVVATTGAHRRHMQDRDLSIAAVNVITKSRTSNGATLPRSDVALRLLSGRSSVWFRKSARRSPPKAAWMWWRIERNSSLQFIARLHSAGIRISLFVDPKLEQIDAAGWSLGADMADQHRKTG